MWDEPSLVDRFHRIHSKIRSRFPRIDRDLYGNRRIYLNSAAGTLMVDSAIRALARTAELAIPQPGDIDPAETATAQLHWRVRQIVADFLHSGNPEEVSFHFSTTHALFSLAYSFRSVLSREMNLVVTDLDHMANISPWEDLWGVEKGCPIRRARVNEEGCLDIDHLLSLVDGKTGLVALTMASNGFGSLVPVGRVVPSVREKAPSALICVDAVHHALHGPVDVRDMDCDVLVFSGYKVFGPMLGVLWGKKDVLERLRPYRVETNVDEAPYKFEQGTLNNALLASLEGALEYLLWLGEALAPDDRENQKPRGEKFRLVMDAISAYEREISRSILEGFQRFDPGRFRCHGLTDPGRVTERDPTFSFEIKGRHPKDIKRYLWEENGLQIAEGTHYSGAIHRHLGYDSLCRASFAHYDTLENAKTFLNALETFIKGPSTL